MGSLYFEPRVEAAPAIAYVGAISPDDAFTLNSRPGSKRTIYLDFDGHTATGTAWNNFPALGTGSTINASPFDTDGNLTSFSVSERESIIQAWLAVVEDYAIYDVNITTQDPGPDALNRSSFADDVFGSRAVITDFSNPIAQNCECGGVAFVGVFNESSSSNYSPAWVFVENVQNGKIIAEIASHEVGHNLGLLHHGKYSDEYYLGANGWAPLMGAGYYEPVTTWSNGQYTGATKNQDDINVMSFYGLDFLQDDFANSAASATSLKHNVSTTGVINSRVDVDYFRVSIGDSNLIVDVNVAEFSPNLDVLIEVFDTNGVLVASANPAFNKLGDEAATGLNASVTVNVPAGTYYIKVDGIGTSAYSDYGSVGQYSIKAQYNIFNEGQVSVAGLSKVNSTLSAITGVWVPTPSSFTYQWFANDVAIVGATGPTYSVTPDQNSAAIKVQVTGINAQGESEATASVPLQIQSTPTSGVLSVKRSAKKFALSWTAGNGDGANILRYEYQVKVGKKKWGSWKSTGLNLKATVSKLVAKTKYQFKMRVVTEIGSATSNRVTLKTP